MKKSMKAFVKMVSYVTGVDTNWKCFNWPNLKMCSRCFSSVSFIYLAKIGTREARERDSNTKRTRGWAYLLRVPSAVLVRFAKFHSQGFCGIFKGIQQEITCFRIGNSHTHKGSCPSQGLYGAGGPPQPGNRGRRPKFLGQMLNEVCVYHIEVDAQYASK